MNKLIKKQSLIGSVMNFTKPHLKFFYLAVFFTLISTSSGLLGPLLVGKALNLMFSEGNVDFNGITKIVILLITLYAFSAFIKYFGGRVTNIFTQKTIKEIRVSLFSKLNRLPISYLDSRHKGDIMSKMINDIDTIAEGLLQGVTQLIGFATMIICSITFMFILNPFIALAVISITPLSVIMSYYISKRAQKLYYERQKALGVVTTYSDEYLGNEKVVKAFAYEDKSIEGFGVINEELRKVSKRALLNSAFINPSTRFINNIVYITTGIMGIALNAGIGVIGSFLMYSNQFTKPFNEVTGIITDLQSAVAASRRVMEFYNSEEIIDTGDKNEVDFINRIDFKNVNFSYDKSKPLITNFNLSAERGKKIAIVGPTGSGKTTLVNLLMRFYDIDQGAILMDNIDIRDINASELRVNFGMVLQDTWLNGGTIRENIAYGKTDATFEEIENAAKSAFCDDLINKLPDGYNTRLVNGGNLSEGERQLICIARVMLVSPPILIFDEATSNIDVVSEKKIQAAFDQIMKGRTSFVIAHRLSTIESADVILVINNGNIIEQGKHKELLAKKGFYYKLYISQFEGAIL